MTNTGFQILVVINNAAVNILYMLFGAQVYALLLSKSLKTELLNHAADSVSDHELLIAKFRLKLKRVGKTNRPCRYDLNQIPYDYTVEVTNRFKGLDLIASA